MLYVHILPMNFLTISVGPLDFSTYCTVLYHLYLVNSKRANISNGPVQ